MSATVLPFRQKQVTGTVPKPDIWKCKCGSEVFRFSATGDVWCWGACGAYICNLIVTRR